jgi:hypothetical protein
MSFKFFSFYSSFLSVFFSSSFGLFEIIPVRILFFLYCSLPLRFFLDLYSEFVLHRLISASRLLAIVCLKEIKNKKCFTVMLVHLVL